MTTRIDFAPGPMPDHRVCPKCGRHVYRGTAKITPDECGTEDAIGCQAYRRGVEVGRDIGRELERRRRDG